jgi:hypothetical protein
MGKALDQLAEEAPAGSPASPDEIAEAIVFLATDRSSFVYSTKLVVDGGRRRLAVPKDKIAGHSSQVEGHQQRMVSSATNLISIKTPQF